MKRFIRIYRPPNLEAEIVEAKRRLEEMMEQAAALLAAPLPDTFLGRAHHEILPLPYEQE